MPAKDSRKQRRVSSRVKVEELTEFVEIDSPEKGRRLKIKSPQTIEVSDPELELNATVTLEWSAELGQMIVTGCDLRSYSKEGITSTAWRKFRLSSLLKTARRDAVIMWTLVQTSPERWTPLGNEPLPDESEEEYVARIYRMAAVAGWDSTKAVQDALGVAESTAAQKVVLARKLGLLPPTTSGKARG
jgi:hypothetical protein